MFDDIHLPPCPTKWDYVALISSVSSPSGDLLLKLMDLYGANSLQELTEEQVKEFWNFLGQNNCN